MRLSFWSRPRTGSCPVPIPHAREVEFGIPPAVMDAVTDIYESASVILMAKAGGIVEVLEAGMVGKKPGKSSFSTMPGTKNRSRLQG